MLSSMHKFALEPQISPLEHWKAYGLQGYCGSSSSLLAGSVSIKIYDVLRGEATVKKTLEPLH